MITSMSKAELYRTIMGYDSPVYNRPTTVTAEIAGNSSAAGSVNWKTIGGNQKPSGTVTPANMDTFTYSDNVKVNYGNFLGLTIERNTDRLEISDEAKAASEANQYIVPYELSDVINFKGDIHFRARIESGIPGCIPTEERIAETYGNMAKRLDAAYAEGKFTKDEYDELNSMIAEHMEWETTCAENNKAFLAISARKYNQPYKQSVERIRRENAMTPEQLREEMQVQISDYVRKYCQYDRSAILNMFNSIRYGK